MSYLNLTPSLLYSVLRHQNLKHKTGQQSAVVKGIVSSVKVQQVRNLDLAHKWHWLSNMGQIDKVIFFNCSYILIQDD